MFDVHRFSYFSQPDKCIIIYKRKGKTTNPVNSSSTKWLEANISVANHCRISTEAYFSISA